MTKFFEALGRNVVATVLLVLAAIFVCYKTYSMGPQAAGLAVVAMVCAVFVLAYLVLTLDAHKAELVKLLEPRCGYGSTADVHDPYSEKAHRQRLELAAMNSLASSVNALCGDWYPEKLGGEMRQAIDAMLGVIPTTMSATACNCGPNEACSNCPRNMPATKSTAYAVMQAAGYTQSDDPVEAMIQAKGKTAPRVTPADIEANIVRCDYFTAKDAIAGYHPAISILIEGVRKHAPEVLGAWDAARAKVADGMPESLGLLTFCVLTMSDGAVVTGQSMCPHASVFSSERARELALADAKQKLQGLNV